MFVYKYSITIKTKNKNKNKSYRTENSTYASTLLKESHYCYNVEFETLNCSRHNTFSWDLAWCADTKYWQEQIRSHYFLLILDHSFEWDLFYINWQRFKQQLYHFYPSDGESTIKNNRTLRRTSEKPVSVLQSAQGSLALLKPWLWFYLCTCLPAYKKKK